MSNNIKIPKKLIEVALPLNDINAAAVREKSIRHGHPSTLHLWWSRKPLAAARAVLFAQLVNDPGGERGWTNIKTKAQAAQEREKLFDIIRDLVKWENTNNTAVINRAKAAIKKSWEETCKLNKNKPGFDPEKLPGFHDPFAGGGSIPLEAQRLGLESYASDLNPVAVILNKAMIEIPPKFNGWEPVGPIENGQKYNEIVGAWQGTQGLAEDVQRYGNWMRQEAFKKIGDLYPTIEITKEMTTDREDLQNYLGEELTIIAWIWARTVKSPNPVFNHLHVPLISSFVLSSKKGHETWVEIITKDENYRFDVKKGGYPKEAKKGTNISRGSFRCVFSNTPITYSYIDEEANAGRLGKRLFAIVAEGKRGRVFLSPTEAMESIADKAIPSWRPATACRGTFASNAQGRIYGFKTFGDYFTPRQLVALTTFSDLILEARKDAINRATKKGIVNDHIGLDDGGTGATAYGDAIALYLSLGVNRLSDRCSTICSWDSGYTKIRNTFGRQAIPMTWTYCEGNVFSNSTGNFSSLLGWIVKFLKDSGSTMHGKAYQEDAIIQKISSEKIISTDPPYYDNVGYADLSDYFYVWMRRSLRQIFPKLFSTMAVPKAEELMATPYRHGSKKAADAFFMDGMTNALRNMVEHANANFPVCIYYAFKQSETNAEGTSSTGWETFLEAVIRSGFSIVGTWPMRTELSNRIVGYQTNALASSVVLVCKKRNLNAEIISRRQFQKQLREKMAEALEDILGGTDGISPISPVDLAQAAIGPGMAIFSNYKSILNQDGSNMSIHDALILINRAITEYLHPDSGDFDSDTLFCDDWFSQKGWGEGLFGEANVLAQAKGTTVDGVAAAGVAESGGGKVRLLKWNEYPTDWDPQKDKRTPIWEACHQMIRVLNQQGETEAGALLAKMPDKGEAIRQLAYHLYTQCERKKWAEEARAYNELIGSWHAIVSASQETVTPERDRQLELDF